MNTEIFFNAAVNKYRFQTVKGSVTTEQLFDLKPFELDALYSNMKKELADASEAESLFSKQKPSNNKLKEMIAIIEAVAEYKQKLAADYAAQQSKAQQKAKALEVLAKRRDKAMEELSDEALVALIND